MQKESWNQDLIVLFMANTRPTVSIEEIQIQSQFAEMRYVWHCYNHVSWFAEECLLSYKNWCIVLVTFMSVPLCLFCWAVNLDLAWTYYFTGILIASSVVPIAFSIIWARATAKGNMKAQIIYNSLSNLYL